MATHNVPVEVLFDEGALILHDSQLRETPPEAGKTPTTPVQATDLAATVDGGNGEECCGSMPRQGLRVSFINAESSFYVMPVPLYFIILGKPLI